MPDTFCVEPWTRIVVLPDGRVTPCCNWTSTVGSLYRNTISEIWNGESLRGLRTALARGEAHPACSACWREESAGVTSLRQRSNQAYRQMHGALPREQLITAAEESGHCAEDPQSYSFSIGNVCNLKCRSCHEAFSTRIGADRVHRNWGHEPLRPAWRGHRLQVAPELARGVRYHCFETVRVGQRDALRACESAIINVPANGSRLRALKLDLECPSSWRLRISTDSEVVHEVRCDAGVLRREFPIDADKVDELQIAFDVDAPLALYVLEIERNAAAAPLNVVPAAASPWFADVSSLSTLFERRSGDVTLSLLGGEPLLNDDIWALLTQLVARGAAARTTLALYTNGTRQREELAQLAPAFRKVYVSVSIDGFGSLFEYLRYGARWSEILRNLQWLRTLPNVELLATPTLQAYNVVDCLRLFRFFDAHDIPYSPNVLQIPARLHILNLPPKVRRIAAARLRGYLEAECRADRRSAVQALVDLLESAGERFDASLFREFMLFTNDLDAMRGQCFADAAPDLVALIAAAGVPWIDDLHHAEKALRKPRKAMSFQSLLSRINRTISPHDVIYPGFEATGTDNYYRSALGQLDMLDGLLRRHGHAGIRACGAMADYASHYGRMTRALRAVAPDATVYACDIDSQAIAFCQRELGARPMATTWFPDADEAPTDLDLVVCSSLLTHTALDHWRSALRAWMRMVRPGGFVFFTYLSDAHLDDWRAGRLGHYGTYSAEQYDAAARQLRQSGLGFAALETVYSGEGRYGIAMVTAETVRTEARAAGFDVLDLVAAPLSTFGQDLAVLRRPPQKRRAAGENVRVVAFYDAAGDQWTTLCAASPPPPMPTELGFCDPRVAEVREEQAALARAHGIDGFCVAVPLHDGRFESPALEDLLSTGRPDFPFCLMLSTVGEGRALTEAEAERIFAQLLPYLRDGRYISVDDLPLLVVQDACMLSRDVTQQWRRIAVQRGLLGLHLCAMEFPNSPSPAEIGFDSLLEFPKERHTSYAEFASASLARATPAYRIFRSVLCRRHPSTDKEIDLYELWLRTVLETTRDQSGGLVFVRSWNDWTGGSYLEPDERDGLRALSATRRAVTGPASGAVLLQKLRASLDAEAPQNRMLIVELEELLALREQSFSELGSLVEASLSICAPLEPSTKHDLRIQSVHLRPAPEGFRFCIDQVGMTHGDALQCAVVEARRANFRVAGWSYNPDQNVGRTDFFIVLQSLSNHEDFFFFLPERNARPDVVAALHDVHPGVPLLCGFDAQLDLDALREGDYRLGFVQRSPAGAYCDFADFVVRLG